MRRSRSNRRTPGRALLVGTVGAVPATRAATLTARSERRRSHDEETGVPIDVALLPPGDCGVVRREDMG